MKENIYCSLVRKGTNKLTKCQICEWISPILEKISDKFYRNGIESNNNYTHRGCSREVLTKMSAPFFLVNFWTS